MDDRFKDVAMRLIESVGQEVDREFFAEDDCWAFVSDLAQFAEDGKLLSAATQQVLLDVGVALGLKPGCAEGAFRPALEAQLGACPLGEETIVAVVRYVRAQANGQFEEGRSASERAKLTGGTQAGPHTPHKNYDFGSD